MRTNSNRSIKLLSLSISLAVAGCSQTPKHNLSIDSRPPVVSKKENAYIGHSSYRSFTQKKYNSSPINTVWERLFSLYALPEINNDRIDREVNWYLRHTDALIALQQRAAPYMHHILDEIEAKNIPGELALLPVVESSFMPDAYSKSDASGLWQFIPSTGRLFGLEQNSWYDGRRDVYASTKAATEYLKQLCETFDGDWLLALASYNWGKGNVRKSIEKNQYLDLPTDYWSLSLPEETTSYVPRLLAIAKIFANAEEYHIPLQYIPNKPYFEVVDLKAPIDLNKAANLANTPISEFRKLNPGFNRWCTAPDGPHRLLIPVKQAQAFKRNLAQLPYDKWVTFPARQEELQLAQHQTQFDVSSTAKRRHHIIGANLADSRYRVKPGENLTSIARKNHTTVAAIRRANHMASRTVNSGAWLKIPSSKKSTELNILAKSSKINALASNNKYHIVKKGDTFWNVAQRYSVTTKDIANWNNIRLNSALILGKKLTIKSKDPQIASSSSTLRLIRYTVRPGDSLTQISRKFSISVPELRKSNADTLVKGLRPGQKLKVLVDNSQPTT
ncbi:MAG: LysM peptidoglycan-binding domain-containing protein [Methylosarcina sp.]